MILLSSSLNSLLQLIGALLIFLFVLVITYLTTRWIGSYQKVNMQNKNLQVVESLKVGTNKCIVLVKTGKIYLVVAIGKDEMTVLAQLTEEQLSEVPSFESGTSQVLPQNVTESFQNILEKMKNNFPKKQG